MLWTQRVITIYILQIAGEEGYISANMRLAGKDNVKIKGGAGKQNLCYRLLSPTHSVLIWMAGAANLCTFTEPLHG